MRQALAGRLSSPRRRRRLAWSGGALLVVGAAVAAGVIWPNTGHSVQLPQHEGVKAVFRTPASVPFTGARGDAVLRVEQRFVEHAVFRHDVAAAYDLVTPSLRGSLTRERWAALIGQWRQVDGLGGGQGPDKRGLPARRQVS